MTTANPQSPSFNRRRLIAAGGLALGSLGAVELGLGDRAMAAPPAPARAPDDEPGWRRIADLYDKPKGVLQLENGNWGVMARPVREAYERHTKMVNRDASYYSRRHYGEDFAMVRCRVAAALGVAADEIALTRGATEALQALIGGYNRLQPGDGVLYADLDYDSMQTAMTWLKIRRGADIVAIDLPEPASRENLVATYVAALDANPHVKLILLTHLSHRTGLVVPVAEIVEMARARGVDAIVDAAHSWGQIDFRLPALGADFVGVNLHKWIGAPIGVGALYIRSSRISAIDPFMNEPVRESDPVLARVHTGTANYAAFLSVPDALDFHDSVGGAAKAARLKYLRNRWTQEFSGDDRIQIMTPDDPALSAGITSFRLRGAVSVDDNRRLANRFLEEHGIFTVLRTGVASGACVRVTPALFNTGADMDRLVDAIRAIATR